MSGNSRAQGNKKEEEDVVRVIPEDQVSQVQAHQLLDFDWKLKYAVSSDSVASVNEPIARVEFCISKETLPMDLHGTVAQTHHHDMVPVGGSPRTIVAEYTKPELARLIADLEEMVQALEGTRSSTGASLPK